MRRRRGFGLVLGLVLVLLTILGVGLMAQGSLSSGVADAVERDLRAEEAATLAESAVDEALVHIALEANGGADGRGAGKIFSLFRGASNPEWDPQLGFAVPMALTDLPAFSKMLASRPLQARPAPEVTAKVRFQRFFDSSGFKEHDDRFGTLEISATVAARGGRRRVTRWYEFRVVRTALPSPFDRTTFHVHHPEGLVNTHARSPGRSVDWANDVLFDIARTLPAILPRVGALTTAVQKMRDALQGKGVDDLVGQMDRVIAAFEAARQQIETATQAVENDLRKLEPPNLSAQPLRPFGWPFVMYTLRPDRSVPVQDLGAFNLAARNGELLPRLADADRREKAASAEWIRLIQSNSKQIEGPGIALAQALADRAQIRKDILTVYRNFQTSHFEQGGEDKVKLWSTYRAVLDEQAYKPLGAPPGTSGVRLSSSKASFIVGPATDATGLLRELELLLTRYGPAFTGVVYVDNAGGPELTLDATLPDGARWGQFSGRLVLAVAGDCRLRGVRRSSPQSDLLTVICYGALTLSGEVQASVVARGPLRRAAGAARPVTLTGNLLLAGPAFTQADPAPDQLLEGITVKHDDAVLGTGKPPHSTVVFGPDAIYTNALRQVPK